MNKSFCLFFSVAFTSYGVNAAPNPVAQQSSPNIILFLVDDMGWMDCSVNGSKFYNTPNMERMAQAGVVFKAAYTNPLSAPSRASIITGRAAERNGITSADAPNKPNLEQPLFGNVSELWHKVIPPTSRNFLPLKEKTIAERLKSLGYLTCHIGKWHLGMQPYYASNQGFDISIASGHDAWPPSYFPPYHLPNLEDGDDSQKYLTDRLTEEAEKFLEQHKDEKFFLNFWHYAVHDPFQAPSEYIEKYRNKISSSSHQKNPIMGAMIEKMDESLGRILDKIEELGIADNTIIVFYSDNGGEINKKVEGIPATSCYPLRGGKATIYEGGIRVPCIIVWPGHVTAGTECNVPIVSYDLLPTFVDIAGGKISKKESLDGKSLKPLLLPDSENKFERDGVVVRFPHYTMVQNNVPAIACMDGKWKLILKEGEGPNRTDAFELYDLQNDISESINVAEQHPDIVIKLKNIIKRHVRNTGFPKLPLNPLYSPNAQRPM